MQDKRHFKNAAINLPREGASSLGLADECGLGRGFQGEGAVGELDSPTQDPRADAGSAHSPSGFPHEQLVQEDTVRLSQTASVA